MKYFNDEVLRVLSVIIERMGTSSIAHFGKDSMKINDSTMERPSREAVIVSNAIVREKNTSLINFHSIAH